MKRRGIVLIITCTFNLIIVFGITYINNVIYDNNLLIRFKGYEGGITDKNPTDDPNIDSSYKNEKASSIGKKLDKHFAKKELEGLGTYIAQTSIKRGVNPYLVGGIIMANTNCQTECSVLVKNCYNVGDLKGDPGCFGGSFKKYKSITDGIDDLIDYIYEKFTSKNVNNPSSMYQKFGKDTSWSYKVNLYMEKLKG